MTPTPHLQLEFEESGKAELTGQQQQALLKGRRAAWCRADFAVPSFAEYHVPNIVSLRGRMGVIKRPHMQACQAIDQASSYLAYIQGRLALSIEDSH
ncbi:hypothetical protein WJX73_002393 [Symbiochloris irregularis]|uniref:Uncharacterized protein n=1 Tax=Symbiochloris irregularis TaxID=706552 RepID=A0AAW1PFP9_9CHLO